MNSSEQREFESVTPARTEILGTISIIEQKLQLPVFSLAANEKVKEGYTEAIIVLTENRNSYSQISTLLTSDVSRAIAVLAVNYINGECSRETFLSLIPD